MQHIHGGVEELQKKRCHSCHYIYHGDAPTRALCETTNLRPSPLEDHAMAMDTADVAEDHTEQRQPACARGRTVAERDCVMGTNFYIVDAYGKEVIHLGKRSAAGWWCWDCNLTLCKKGNAFVHHGNAGWHDVCPSCGDTAGKEEWHRGAVAIELGFTPFRIHEKKPIGVHSCSSWTWAVDPSCWDDRLHETTCWEFLDIADEYGDLMVYEDFVAMLAACPIHLDHMIGQAFS